MEVIASKLEIGMTLNMSNVLGERAFGKVTNVELSTALCGGMDNVLIHMDIDGHKTKFSFAPGRKFQVMN